MKDGAHSYTATGAAEPPLRTAAARFPLLSHGTGRCCFYCTAASTRAARINPDPE